jgi:hypothetical protein
MNQWTSELSHHPKHFWRFLARADLHNSRPSEVWTPIAPSSLPGNHRMLRIDSHVRLEFTYRRPTFFLSVEPFERICWRIILFLKVVNFAWYLKIEYWWFHSWKKSRTRRDSLRSNARRDALTLNFHTEFLCLKTSRGIDGDAEWDALASYFHEFVLNVLDGFHCAGLLRTLLCESPLVSSECSFFQFNAVQFLKSDEFFQLFKFDICGCLLRVSMGVFADLAEGCLHLMAW